MSSRRALTVEEYRALPPPTEEELARQRAINAEIFAEVRRRHADFLAAGGTVMTDEEWQEYWDHRWDEDEEEWGDIPGK
jgi:hypothetical protein